MLKTKKSKTNQKSKTLHPCGQSGIVFMGVLLGVIFIGAFLVVNGILSESMVETISLLAVFLGSLFGAIPILRWMKENKPLAALVYASILSLGILAIKWLIWPELKTGNWWVFGALVLGTVMALFMNGKKKVRRRA